MKKVYEGKTKDVYELEDGKTQLMEFKDDVTGTEEGIDPGANEVIGKLQDKGFASLQMTEYFFRRLKEQGIPTHFIEADLEKKTMKVHKADSFGFEVICRLYSYGSFVRRYPHLTYKMQPLNYLVEVTIKDDALGDPLINDDALITLEVLCREELDDIKDITKRAGKILENGLKDNGLDLIDFKIEFGRIEDEIAIIDEISGDGMRVMKDGETINQLELKEYLLK